MFIKRIESLLYLNNRKYKYKDQWIDVAMKEISSDRVGRNKQLFEREKNLPRYINHVNIIKYYGSGDYQDKNHPEDVHAKLRYSKDMYSGSMRDETLEIIRTLENTRTQFVVVKR